MADKYWVGGSGNWSDDDNHWATTSGGTPANGNLPTNSDNVFIDSNSGLTGGTITLTANADCNNFTSTTGVNYTITDNNNWLELVIYGSSIFEIGISWGLKITVSFEATTTGKTITNNGMAFNCLVKFWGNGGEWTLQDDMIQTGNTDSVEFYIGTFRANGYNLTADNFYVNGNTANYITIYMGSGTWECTGNYNNYYPWVVVNNAIIYCENSTIKFTDISVESVCFYGGDKTYNNVWFCKNPSSARIYDFISIYGSNTFREIRIDNPPQIIKFNQGTTQTVSEFIVSGEGGRYVTLNSVNGTSQFTLSKVSNQVKCDYLNIKNSVVTGGADWLAGSNSINSGNNTGWIFGDMPTRVIPTIPDKLNTDDFPMFTQLGDVSFPWYNK